MDIRRTGGWVFGLEAKDGMAKFGYRPRHVFQRLHPLKPDFDDLTRGHSLDDKFGSNKGEGTDLIGYIEMNICIGAVLTWHCIVH